MTKFVHAVSSYFCHLLIPVMNVLLEQGTGVSVSYTWMENSASKAAHDELFNMTMYRSTLSNSTENINVAAIANLEEPPVPASKHCKSINIQCHGGSHIQTLGNSRRRFQLFRRSVKRLIFLFFLLFKPVYSILLLYNLQCNKLGYP